jgi:hypothetical protein
LLAHVALVGLFERGCEPGALAGRVGEVRFDLAQAALHGVEAGFGLRQLARQSRAFRARVAEQGLLRALFVVGQRQPLARGIEVGFKRDHALVGGDQPFVEAAVLFAQRIGFAGLLRETRFQVGDLGAARGDVDGDFGPGRFQRAQLGLRGGEVLA